MADVNAAAAPTSIKAYLDALKRCLKGQPPALIQDALADAEEYLRAEQAQTPEESEAQVLARIVETYGTPHEVAEEYIAMEQTVSSPFPARDDDAVAESGPGLFGVLVDPRAYGALIYMLLSLATGIFYFTWAVTGMSLTLGLAILIIGIPFAILFIGSIRVISWVEGRVVEALLGVRMPRRLPSQEEGGTIWSRPAPITWTAVPMASGCGMRRVSIDAATRVLSGCTLARYSSIDLSSGPRENIFCRSMSRLNSCLCCTARSRCSG